MLEMRFNSKGICYFCDLYHKMQVMKKKFVALLASTILMLFNTAAAQNLKSSLIEGRVLSSEGKAIPWVQILNTKTASGATSDLEGYFILKVEQKSPVRLAFEHLAYETEYRIIDLKDSITNIEDVSLNPLTQPLEEIEITAAVSNNNPLNTSGIEKSQIEERNINDPGELLKLIPNVATIKKSPNVGDPVVRGLKYSQLNVQLNSAAKIEGACPNRMDPVTAHIDPDDIKSVRVYKGPYTLKYGVNFGGIIKIQTFSALFTEQYESHIRLITGVQTNHEGLRAGLKISGSNSWLSYQLTGNHKQYGDYTAGNGDIIQASMKKQNFGVALGFRPKDGHVISAYYDQSRGRNIDFPALPMDERSDLTRVVGLSYVINNISPVFSRIKANAWYSDVDHEMDNKNRPFSDTVVAISALNTRNTGAKLGAALKFGKLDLNFGGDYESVFKTGDRDKNLIMQPMLPVLTESLWNNARIDNLGFYGEGIFKTKKMEWVVAARLDLNYASSDPIFQYKSGDYKIMIVDTESQFTNFSYSASMVFHLNSKQDLFVSFGSGTRSPDMTERFVTMLPIAYDNFDYLGNPALKPETNTEFDLGYRLNQSRYLSLEASLFFSYLSNHIVGTMENLPAGISPRTKGVYGVKRFENSDAVYLSGFELSLATPLHYRLQFLFNASYTYGLAPEAFEYVIENGKVDEVIRINDDALPEIPPFEMNLKLSYQLLQQRLQPSLNLRLVAAQKHISKSYVEQETPGFAILDLGLKYHYNSNLAVYAGVNNLFDQLYYEHLNRRIIGSKSPLYEPGRVFYVNVIIKF